jgi:hypothetical protein
MYELHRKSKTNVGDAFCNPSRYFEFPNIKTVDIMRAPDVKGDTIIVGGGGLIHNKFGPKIAELVDRADKSILWAIGHNFSKKAERKHTNSIWYPEYTSKASLAGIRDVGKFYLPCVSCMHPAFNKNYTSTHDYVYFTHHFKSKFDQADVPHMTNAEMDFDKVISFLASGDTIITDSYHGAYWGQLLGKNVQVVSWSVKFNYMKHTPHYVTSINEQPIYIKNSVTGFLEECKDYNKKFYQKVLDIL